MIPRPEAAPGVPHWTRHVPPPVAMMVALATMIALNLGLPGPRLVSWPWSLVGMGLIALALLWAASAQFAFMRAGATPHLFRGNPSLVARGPFRVSRNPMYLGLVVTLCGAAILMGTLTPWVGPVMLFFWLDRAFIPHEEAVLAAHFGPSWEDYSSRVRRWI